MRRMLAAVPVLAFVLLGAQSGAPDPDSLPPAVAAALQGVVSVRVHEVERVPVFRNGRFEMEAIEGGGAGSGVVVSEDGLILTNAHVVEGGSDVHIRLPAGGEADARVVAVDHASDLALLRAGGGGFHPILFAEGGLPASGTAAFVVGDRGDAGPQVAWATIGPHRRVRVGARPLEFWCEVDATIGPGNSGGALLDEGGKLLGIPSLEIHYAAQAARAVPRTAGLFIPASHVHRALSKMIGGAATITWPWIGLLLEDPMMAASEGTGSGDDNEVRVRRVFPGSPAEKAGFRRGDRILAVGARRPRDNFEALDAVLDLAPGGVVTVEVERAAARLQIGVTAGTRPPDPRPDPLDDFALHTGLLLRSRFDPEDGRTVLASAGLSPRARNDMLPPEIELFAHGPILGALLPGEDALAGQSKRFPITSPGDLSTLLPRCFVREQFVALAHWTDAKRRTADRAHVHRKIYPVVL